MVPENADTRTQILASGINEVEWLGSLVRKLGEHRAQATCREIGSNVKFRQSHDAASIHRDGTQQIALTRRDSATHLDLVLTFFRLEMPAIPGAVKAEIQAAV